MADSTLTLQYAGGGVGDGGLSFQRPDGKFVTIFGGSVPSKAVNIYDAGWYADGQYLSEEMNVPALAANATLDWQQTPDQYVRMAARVAASQGALADASYAPIANPGGSIGNAGGETWAQVQINFRRDFPTFSGNLNGVYNSSGGMTYIYRPISTPTVNSYQITNGQDLLTLGTNGNNVLRVTSDGNIMSSATGGFYTGGADLAENYTSNDALQKGEIVSVDATDSHNVKRSSSAYESDVLGVVSTAPGFVAGTYTDQSYPIALVGRVPVNVSTQNGMIQAGDRITAASTPGYGMRATVAGRVIGTALESMDLSAMTDCPATNGISSEYKCGQINVFVNLADYQGMPVETLMSEADSSSLTVDDNNSLGTIDPASPLAQYSSQEKVLAFLQNLKDTQTSYSASDILAGNVNAINQIVSPLIVTDTLVAKNIKAENIEGLQFIQTDIQNTQDGIATATTEVKSLGQQVADLQNTVKVLTDDGGITLDGPAQFNGPAVFKAMAEFFDKVVFHKDVAFEGQITFNADTAGYAIVKEGNDNVVVNFSREYATPPVVNASISLQQESNDEVRKATEELLLITNANFIITNVTTKGFEIKIASKTLSDIPFSWTAIAVKDAKTFDAAEKGYAGADGSPAVSAAATDTVETPDTNAGADESPAAAADATVSDTATTPVAGNDTATAVSISSETSPGVAADASSTAVTN